MSGFRDGLEVEAGVFGFGFGLRLLGGGFSCLAAA
jgi:hypothetical protein